MRGALQQQSILAKAFAKHFPVLCPAGQPAAVQNGSRPFCRGELVPQDPNDEPADKLLERIATARIEAEALAKAVKKAETAKKRAAKAARV